jgi:hypothetical protein
MPITINGSGTVAGISAGGLLDGIIKAAELDGAQTGTAPIYGCRAWVNFDGTRNEADTGASTNGANVKIRASGNVTSVLKNATGDYTVNFTTAMVDANYSVAGFASRTSAGEPAPCNGLQGTAFTSSSCRVQAGNTANALNDALYFCVTVFR